MSTASNTHPERSRTVRPAARHLARRAVEARARSWTGRAAVSFATDSHLSRLVTGGARVTRVSALRDASARIDRHSPKGTPVDAGAATPQRRWCPGPPTVSG